MEHNMDVAKEISTQCLRDNKPLNETIDMFELFSIHNEYDDERDCMIYEFEDRSVAVIASESHSVFKSKREFYKHFSEKNRLESSE